MRTGDWEGNTVEGERKKGYVATLSERHSKYRVAYTLDCKVSDKLVKDAKNAFWGIPEEYRKMLTVDNGKEFTRHQELSKSLKGKVYFANSYHTMERDLNDNTNGIHRQYLPKKKFFEDLTQKELTKNSEQA